MDANEAQGIADRLRRLADNALETVQNRLALLTVEVQSEAIRVGAALFNIVLAALFAGFGILAVVIFLTVYFWDSHRLLTLGLDAAFFLILAAWTGNKARSRFLRDKHLFEDSIANIERDRAALRDRDT
ncbi:MAG: phage holin family protein [Betaproteobacteria bacterium]|nr:phage holin family protein [Betaproteobacteria bacterium]